MSMKTTTLKNAIEVKSKQILEILDDTKLDPGRQIAKSKPIEEEINRLREQLVEEEYLDQKRKSFGRAGDAGGSGLDLAGTPSDALGSGRTAADDVKSIAMKRWAADVQPKLAQSVIGTKALVTGAVDQPSIFQAVQTIPGRPTSVLQLIPALPPEALREGNLFGYQKQTARTLNASSVPDGVTKPTSTITFDEVEDHLRVYATLSETLPKRYQTDFPKLMSILQGQLFEALTEAVEVDILSGSGTATSSTDPFLGILNQPGILTQAWSTDLLGTLSTAKYKLTKSYVAPNAWVMHPDDLQRLELMRENGTTGALLFGSGRSSVEQILGNYPIVESNLIPAGTALLGDFSQTGWASKDNEISWDGSGGTRYEKNQVVYRSEGRYGFAVLRPSAFVKVSLVSA